MEILLGPFNSHTYTMLLPMTRNGWNRNQKPNNS